MSNEPEIWSPAFKDVYNIMKPDLAGWARATRIVGYTADEIYSSMLDALYTAWSTWDHNRGVSFRYYSKLVWYRTKATMIESAMAKKRTMLVWSDPETMEEIGEAFGIEVSVIPECPIADDLVQQVWTLLAQGYLVGEVKALLNLSWRAWEKIITMLRCDAVTEVLLP